MMVSQLLRRVLAISLFGIGLWQAWLFPVFALPLTMGLALYGLILVREPRVWLLLLPGVLAVLSLGFWSGRFFWDAADLFLLVTVSGGLWSTVSWWPRHGIRLFWPIALLLVLQAVITLRGLLPIQLPTPGNWQDYLASTNALREAKGYLWAFLLLPMVLQTQQAGKGFARWLVAGMALGLAALAVSIVWERHLYTGLFNFQNAYRVSGWFFDMVTGGAAVDAFLALSFPFALGLWIWWRSLPAAILTLLLALVGAYALYVTYSRANYPAVALIFATLLIGWLTQRHTFRRMSHRRVLISAATFAVLGVLLPLLFGGVIVDRLKASAGDLQTRFDHWQRGLELLVPEQDAVLGVGKGVFPRLYYLDAEARGQHLATLQLNPQAAKSFVHLSASDDAGSVYLRQRVHDATSAGQSRLHLRLRTAPGSRERLLVEFCERHILRVRSECEWRAINVGDTDGDWETYSVGVDLSRLGRGNWWERSPVDIAILNRGIKQGIDIGAVNLAGVDGDEYLFNTDFSRGMDHWFLTDGNHLRWHAKNVFLHLYLEGGLIGLMGFALVFLVALARSWRLHRAGDPLGVFVMAALLGGIAIGLFDSLFDVPRVTLLFNLLLFAGLVLRPEPVILPVGLVDWQRWRPAWWPRAAHPLLLLLTAVVVAAVVKSYSSSGLSFSQTMLRYGERAGLSPAWLTRTFGPTPAPEVAMVASRLRVERPRIWRFAPSTPGSQSSLDFWSARKDMYKQKGVRFTEPCSRQGMRWDAVCWFTSGDESAGARALSALMNMPDVLPRAYGEYGNGWLLAVLYDLLSGLPALDKAAEAMLQQRVRQMLRHHLLLIDSDGPAVWHGRATLAAQAMLLASVLDDRDEEAASLVRRAHYHYLALLDALSLVEAWPEGYNYWINSRAFLVALSAKAYLNAFADTGRETDVRSLFERIGLWHLYNTRPDLRATQIGDEGPRIDLREETRRVIDLIAGITEQPRFMAFSMLLQDRFGAASYYRGYRWLLPLLNDPELSPAADENQRDLTLAGRYLPNAAWFGKGVMNMFYLRGGWDADATFLSFRAGSSLSHHGHYDAGHFTLFKGTPLAVTGATYRGNLKAGHRLNYGIRTVSKNSLLVMRPGEIVRPDDNFKRNIAAGGQRLTMPVHNPLSDLASWQDNIGQGRHLESGEIRGYEHRPDEYTYIDADLTAAYNTPVHDEGGEGGKVRAVRREVVYLRRLDRVLIHDRVLTVSPDYRAKWLLQTQVKPELKDAHLRRGTEDNGILETGQAVYRYSNGRGRLHVLSLLPRQRRTLAVGGKDFRFLADVDGDADTLDGRNMGHNSRITDWFEPALWRIEISNAEPGIEQHFLTLLTPSIDRFRETRARVLSTTDEDAQVIQVDDELLVFVDPISRGRLQLAQPSGVNRLRVFGLPAGGRVTFGVRELEILDSGVFSIKSGDQDRLSLAWELSAPGLETPR